MNRPRTQSIDLVVSSFFMLTLLAALVFDPLYGLGFVLSGLVYMLNKKLAILEVLIIFVAKGEWAYGYAGLVFAPAGPLHNFLILILPYYGSMGMFLGGVIACQTSAKIIRMKLRKHAPDVMEVLDGRRRRIGK